MIRQYGPILAGRTGTSKTQAFLFEVYGVGFEIHRRGAIFLRNGSKPVASFVKGDICWPENSRSAQVQIAMPIKVCLDGKSIAEHVDRRGFEGWGRA